MVTTNVPVVLDHDTMHASCGFPVVPNDEDVAGFKFVFSVWCI